MVDNYSDWDYGQEEEGMDWTPSMQRQDSTALKANDPIIDKEHKVIKITEIKPQIIAAIKRCQDMYALDENDMYLVAKHYRWNEESMQNWFEDQEKLQYDLGLKPKPGMDKDKKLNYSRPENLAKSGNVCMICYEPLVAGKTFALACGHTFCTDCQDDYLKQRLFGDNNMTTANCMVGGCNMKVPHTVFLQRLQSMQDSAHQNYGPSSDYKLVDLYWKWMAKSFSDNNPNIKWCPNPGCDGCFLKSQYDNATTINCHCGTPVCLFCSEEAHGPCDCEQAKAWIFKSKAESENMNWIMANTKPCPKCKKPIEKNQGCNHMSCRECNHGFCWVCLGDWKDHGSGTGGYYKCNKYQEEVKKNTSLQKAEQERERAQSELRRYLFYFERYMNHEKSQKIAQKQRPALEDKIEQLQAIKQYPTKELEFIREAIETVQTCRCVLKWTYAFGYYAKLKEQERARFEYWQEDLEKFCDNLQGFIEKPMDRFLDPNILERSSFYQFKGEMTAQYSATRKHHESLVIGVQEFA